MICSMTGYGKASGLYKEKRISVEIKSLNSKQFDISFKMPSVFGGYENEFRSEVMKKLERGKVYVMMTTEMMGEENSATINTAMAERYMHQFRQLEKLLNLEPSHDYLSLLMRIPEVMKPGIAEPEEEELKYVMELLRQALEQVMLFRREEGHTLAQDLSQRINFISQNTDKVIPFEKQRIVRLRERMEKALGEMAGKNVDQNRFEQELIFYIEKLDITEEKVRLKSHLEYFLKVMNEEGGNGRKLSFISQEIGREINTLGSKANDADIQVIVVEMKDELEKIKEQLMNIL